MRPAEKPLRFLVDEDVPYDVLDRVYSEHGHLQDNVWLAQGRERPLIRDGKRTPPDWPGLRMLIHLAVLEHSYTARVHFVQSGPAPTCDQVFAEDTHLREVCHAAAGSEPEPVVLGACQVQTAEQARALVEGVGAWRSVEVVFDEAASTGAVWALLDELAALGVDAPVWRGPVQPCEGRAVTDAASLDEAAARAVGSGGVLPQDAFSRDGMALRSCSRGCTPVLPPPSDQGCADLPELPAEALAASPRPDADAEMLALEVDQTPLASSATYDRVVADLAAIRAHDPELAGLHMTPAYSEGVVTVGFDPLASAQARGGSWPPEACRARLPPFESEMSVLALRLRFEDRISPESMGEQLESLPGVRYADAAHFAWTDTIPVAAMCVVGEGEVLHYALAGSAVWAFDSNGPGQVRLVGQWKRSEPAPDWISRFSHCRPRPPAPAR